MMILLLRQLKLYNIILLDRTPYQEEDIIQIDLDTVGKFRRTRIYLYLYTTRSLHTNGVSSITATLLLKWSKERMKKHTKKHTKKHMKILNLSRVRINPMHQNSDNSEEFMSYTTVHLLSTIVRTLVSSDLGAPR